MQRKVEQGSAAIQVRMVRSFPMDNADEGILSVDISPDGEFVAGLVDIKTPDWIGYKNPGIYIWRRETGEIIQRLPAYVRSSDELRRKGARWFIPITARGRQLRFTQSSQLLLAERAKLSLWNLQGQKGKRFRVHGGVSRLTMSHDRRWGLTKTVRSFDPRLFTFRLWDITNRQKSAQFILPTDHAVPFGNGAHILALSFRGSVTLHDACTGTVIRDYGRMFELQYELSVSPDGRRALVCGQRSGGPEPCAGAVILDLVSGQIENWLPEVRGSISPCGRMIVGGRWPGELKLWAFPSGRLLYHIPTMTLREETDSPMFWFRLEWPPHVGFTSDGRFFVSTDGTAHLWEVIT